MIVVGGQAPKAIRSVECYDFEEERWDQVAELPSRRCRAGKGNFAATFFVSLKQLFSTGWMSLVLPLASSVPLASSSSFFLPFLPLLSLQTSFPSCPGGCPAL